MVVALVGCVACGESDSQPELLPTAAAGSSGRAQPVVSQGSVVLQPKAAAAATSGALCDGSSDVRVMAYWNPGIGDVSSFFTSPYGKMFFAIDGTCRYYAQDNPAHAIVRGQLKPEQAIELSADLAWEQLPAWGSYRSTIQCADAGGVTLGTQQVAFDCGPVDDRVCGCGPSAPAGLPAMLKGAERWHATLLKNGAPLDGALSAVAQPDTDTSRPRQAWPLARSIASIPDFLVDTSDLASGHRGVLFDDPTEVALLRKLRELQPEAAYSTPSSFSVREGSDPYSIFLRDDIPDADASAMRKLMERFNLQLSAP